MQIYKCACASLIILSLILINVTKVIQHSVEISGFFVIQVLREINFGELRSAETAVLAILGALNIVDLGHFSLQQVPIFTQI